METKRNHDVLPFSDWRSTEDKDRQTDTHIHTIPTEGLCFCSCCLALLHYQPVPSLAGIIWVLKQSIISYLAEKQKLLQGRIPELPCLQSVLGRPDRVPNGHSFSPVSSPPTTAALCSPTYDRRAWQVTGDLPGRWSLTHPHLSLSTVQDTGGHFLLERCFFFSVLHLWLTFTQVSFYRTGCSFYFLADLSASARPLGGGELQRLWKVFTLFYLHSVPRGAQPAPWLEIPSTCWRRGCSCLILSDHLHLNVFQESQNYQATVFLNVCVHG